jgi:hypothetical protein
MSTVNRRRKRHADLLDEPEAEIAPPPRKSRAFRNGCIAMVGLLILAVLLAPTIIAQTSLRNTLPARAIELDGSISLGSLSLGWFSSVVIDDLELRDPENRVIADVKQVRLEKSLLGLLLDMGDVGVVHIDQPTIHVICNEQDTNVERTLAKLIERDDNAKVAIDVRVQDGTVEIEDVPTARSYKVEKLALSCAVADSQQPIMLTASGNLLDGDHSGKFNVQLETRRSDDGKNALASGKVISECTQLPLEMTDPVLRRVVDGAKLAGRISTRLNGAWGKLAESGEASIQGETVVTNLTFAADAIGRDTIRLERVEVPCHLVQSGEVIDIESLGVKCELGNLEVTGNAKLDDLTSEDRLKALTHANYKVNGEVDLVELAKVLPETLRIREGTEITSGKIRLAMTGGHEDGESVWSGQIDASHLGATANGKALVWENPLAVDFSARQGASGVVIDRAECTSSFLHANAAGSLNDLTATANFDLARLVQELQQFADLSEMQLAGTGEAQLQLKREAGDQFTASGRFEARDFQFVPVSGGQPWREPKVVASLELGGKFEEQTLKQIERGIVTVDVGPERLTAQLREVVVDPASATWPVACAWQGELAPWAPRLEACLGITGWALSGSGKLQAQADVSASEIQVSQATAELLQLSAVGNNWFVQEPNVTFTMQAKLDRKAKQAEITAARVTAGTSAAVLNGGKLHQTDEGKWLLDAGTAQFGADVATLYRWRHNPQFATSWRMSGRVAAQAQLKQDASSTTAKIDGVIDQLVLVDLTQPGTGNASATWQEPRITLAALAIYRPATEELRLDQAQFSAAAMSAQASGVVPLSAEGGEIKLDGTLNYDWQQLAAVWRPLLGDGGQLVGKQSRQFNVAGRLTGSPMLADSWRTVNGQAAVGWTGVAVHGLVVGPGDIVANLVDGQVRVQPLDVAVSEGRFTFAPTVRFSPAPAELYIPRGPVLTEVHLTPEMCKRGLKFIAPVVAETTVADGRFSVNMDGGRIPLFDPKGGDVAGHMAIHAQVKPGPVAQEFMVLVNELFSVLKQGNFRPLNDQTGALMAVDTTDIEFRMVQRRIYHRNLKFTLGTMQISTYGSVGLDDESLSMIAEVPLQASLFGRDLSLGNMEGQVLQLPIGGTLSKPQLDRGALRQLTASIVQNLTRGVLQNELGKRLEGLFPRQQSIPAP